MAHSTRPGIARQRIPVDLLLAAYANGLFPMADSRDDESIFWVEPKMRAILPLDGFHLSRSLARTIRRDRFRVTSDTAFAQVIAACAAADDDRPDTWINAVIADSYLQLARSGHAHSVECWDGDDLVGGLYGVRIGRAFFGESMFSRRRDASKVALAWLVARLRLGQFALLDCQFQTDHLRSLGAVEFPQADYLQRLYSAVAGAAAGGTAGGVGAGAGAVSPAGDWSALDAALAAAGRACGVDGAPSGTGRSPGHCIVQFLTNTS